MINLDGMSPEELEEASQVLHNLGYYARVKARAMRDRAAGEINDALAQERICERFYKELPDWAKW